MDAAGRRALVVEDDVDIQSLLAHVLGEAGFAVRTTGSGREALELLRGQGPDLVTLDLGLPDLDGIEVCRSLRAAGSDAYVIMLTARSDEVDRLIGLEVGADDYLTKPFNPRELRARALAMMRRPRSFEHPPVGTAAESVLRWGELRVDVGGRLATLRGAELDLTRIEFDLIVLLLSNPRRVWTREALLQQVWGVNWSHDGHLVEVHVGNLRRKLGDGQQWVRTVRGVGYRLGVGSAE